LNLIEARSWGCRPKLYDVTGSAGYDAAQTSETDVKLKNVESEIRIL
jgi:hypothetical protein